MKREFLYLLILIFALCSCHHDSEPDVPSQQRRTVIVYMAAENSISRYSVSDSTEMALACSQIPSDVNFILYKDGLITPRIYQMSATKGVQLIKKYDRDMDSADSTVMATVLKEIITQFPASHYGLVLWSHANGWVLRQSAPRRRTIFVDNNSNTNSNIGDRMNISELRWVLAQLPHWDYVMFDACFMQNIETAYELRNVTDYTIGSPAEIPGNGAPYNKIMTNLCDADISGIVDGYYTHYVGGSGVALSAIDCSKLDSLAAKTAQYVPSVWSGKLNANLNGVQYYVPFCSSNSWNPEPWDLRGVMYRMLTPEQYQDWNAVMEKTIVDQKATNYWMSMFDGGEHDILTDPEHYSGVSTFIPNSKYAPYGWNASYHAMAWYQAAGWSQTGW